MPIAIECCGCLDLQIHKLFVRWGKPDGQKLFTEYGESHGVEDISFSFRRPFASTSGNCVAPLSDVEVSCVGSKWPAFKSLQWPQDASRRRESKTKNCGFYPGTPQAQ